MGDVCLWIRATLEILALWVENNRYCSQKCLSGACSAWKQNAQLWCEKHFVASLQGEGRTVKEGVSAGGRDVGCPHKL